MSERTVPASAYVRSLALIAALGMAGCPHQELAPLGPCTVSSTAQRVEQHGLSKVDLLFMIDNSGSMASKQIKLAAELPRLVQVLTSGDRDAGRTAPAGGPRMFTPVSSMHLAVVSSNMGGLPDGVPENDTIVGIPACEGYGDDGLFLNSAQVAIDGVTAESPTEFPNYTTGDVVLPPDPNCEGLPAPPPYQDYEAGEDPSADEVAQSFSCISKLGVRGCPIEEQLESMWKALAPSTNDTFLDGTSGHGDPDGDNAGFLRDDAILAVMIVSDEDDCSLTQQGKEYLDTAQNQQDLALGCTFHSDQEGLTQPVKRYIDGLHSLKPNNPDRVIFSAITGIPTRANGQDPQQVLNLPEMQVRQGLLSIVGIGLPQPTCTETTGGRNQEAYPGKRFVQVAAGFTDQVLYSICSDDYGPALDNLIEKIADKLTGNCLPRQLNPDAQGRVPCDVYEILPKGDSDCTSDRGHIGDPIERTIQTGLTVEKRTACKMDQVPVMNGRPASGEAGWYYDDFSQGVKSSCPDGQQQRIVFSFGDLPEGSSATFECFQSALKADVTAHGFDAVNTSCRSNASVCRTRSDTNYTLICVQGTCQAQCKISPDCPPGWVCATSGDTGDGPTYCQLPTCPATETVINVGGDAGT
ncbi:MAG TPA: hypothetical protein VG963_08885 [Polyangiaceae bacterium]|nr:hypothetical protein [Polyangiaceae bacterium]